jgi:hypothetical protein
VAVNSGLLFDRIYSGTPLLDEVLGEDLKFVLGAQDAVHADPRHSRVCSSITVRNFSRRPSCVRSCTKSYDHTWSLCSGRIRMN